MFFHDEVGVIGLRYRPDVDEAGLAHHAQHEPALAFDHLPILITVTGNK